MVLSYYIATQTFVAHLDFESISFFNFFFFFFLYFS